MKEGSRTSLPLAVGEKCEVQSGSDMYIGKLLHCCLISPYDVSKSIAKSLG